MGRNTFGSLRSIGADGVPVGLMVIDSQAIVNGIRQWEWEGRGNFGPWGRLQDNLSRVLEVRGLGDAMHAVSDLVD